MKRAKMERERKGASIEKTYQGHCKNSGGWAEPHLEPHVQLV